MAGRKDLKYWYRLEKFVTKWVQDTNPDIVIMWYPKTSGKTIPQTRYIASANMEDFVKESVEDFVNVAIRTRSHFPKLGEKEEKMINEMPHIMEDSAYLNMDNKRVLITSLVRMYVFKTKNVQRNFWGLQYCRPPFWPKEIEFRSPNTCRNVPGKGLTGEELTVIITCYVKWRENSMPEMTDNEQDRQARHDTPGGDRHETDNEQDGQATEDTSYDRDGQETNIGQDRQSTDNTHDTDRQETASEQDRQETDNAPDRDRQETDIGQDRQETDNEQDRHGTPDRQETDDRDRQETDDRDRHETDIGQDRHATPDRDRQETDNGQDGDATEDTSDRDRQWTDNGQDGQATEDMPDRDRQETDNGQDGQATEGTPDRDRQESQKRKNFFDEYGGTKQRKKGNSEKFLI